MRNKLAVLSSLVLLSLVAGCQGPPPDSANNASYTSENQSGPARASVYCPAVEQRVSRRIART